MLKLKHYDFEHIEYTRGVSEFEGISRNLQGIPEKNERIE
jgi:hypothetical protein